MNNGGAVLARPAGPLTFATVTGVLGDIVSLLTPVPSSLVVDLSQVTHTDSAGIALLLELKRQTSALTCELRLQDAPNQLAELARFFEVDAPLQLPPASPR